MTELTAEEKKEAKQAERAFNEMIEMLKRKGALISVETITIKNEEPGN